MEIQDIKLFGKDILKAFIVIFIWYIIFTVICIILFLTTEGFNNDQNVGVFDKIVDAIYYSSTTFSTIGYGDISPTKWWSKLITVFFQFIILFITFNVVVEQNKKNVERVFDDNNTEKMVLDLLIQKPEKPEEPGKERAVYNIKSLARKALNQNPEIKERLIQSQIQHTKSILDKLEEKNSSSKKLSKNIIVPVNTDN